MAIPNEHAERIFLIILEKLKRKFLYRAASYARLPHLLSVKTGSSCQRRSSIFDDVWGGLLSPYTFRDRQPQVDFLEHLDGCGKKLLEME